LAKAVYLTACRYGWVVDDSASILRRFRIFVGSAAVKVGEKWGYLDRTGAMAITPRFAGAFNFSDGYGYKRDPLVFK